MSTRKQAADLLACLASQPETWPWFIDDAPGRWSPWARRMAKSAWDEVCEAYPNLIWREIYAESEAQLRCTS